MSLVSRKSPFKWLDMFDDFDDLFLGRSERMSMPIDLIDAGENYLVKVDIPGINKDQVSIEVNQAERFIDIKVTEDNESEKDYEQDGVKYIHRERHQRNMARRVRFGSPINPKSAVTEFKEGVLTVTMPKSDEAKVTKLAID